ncbi:hypothetical protein PHYBOEH_011274 [Phytophthora boehmeriae]|uniref:Uncharacterized protein n=1 Tax=Phytophthora boehmeriae TaxID=109152 RepID=A0A8T1WY43_9STRA|nr:hypothetical protein PHYBOEH_011274 [Phytophthora boehmeriae]
MTGTAQVVSSKKTFFRSGKPSAVGSPSTAAKKLLQTRQPNDVSEPETSLPEEAQELKGRLCASRSATPTRFSFSRLRRVVVPPVQIPAELAAPNAVSNVVGGAKIPMTRAMWKRHRARMLRRLPGRIDERVAW